MKAGLRQNSEDRWVGSGGHGNSRRDPSLWFMGRTRPPQLLPHHLSPLVCTPRLWGVEGVEGGGLLQEEPGSRQEGNGAGLCRKGGCESCDRRALTTGSRSCDGTADR